MTIEAALALPVMIFCLYMLMFPLKVMEAERRIQNSMETVAKELSIAEYLQEIAEEKLLKDGDSQNFVGGLIDGAETVLALSSAISADDLKYMRNAGFSSDTSVFSDADDADGDMIYMKFDYEPAFPTMFTKLISPDMSIVTSRRAWIGASGGRGRDTYSEDFDTEDQAEEEETDPDETIVYLGRTSSEVYHLDPNCHYISNDLSSCDISEIGSMTNSSGAHYHACESCNPGSSGTVYYFESGTAYHSSENCKAITAYVHTATLSEVEGMRPCSYCGGSH